jgi:hypothetical protein
MASIDELKSLVSTKLGFASANQFMVELPSDFRGSSGFLGQLFSALQGNDLNLLCASVTMPDRQIFTTDRRIGMEYQKVAYGYGNNDVNMSFYMLNDYGIKKYFDSWYDSTIADDQGVAYYKSSYARDIKIHQLRKPMLNVGIGAGPININVGIGQGTVYSVRLVDAFPTTIGAIELNNDADGLVQLSVQLSYTKWEPLDDYQGFFSIAGGFSGGLSGLLG